MLKKTMLSVVTASALLAGVAAQAGGTETSAKESGVYLGVQGGYGFSDLQDLNGSISINGGPVSSSTNISTHKGDFDGRLYAGYRFNRYLGLETGLSYLPHSSYEFDVTTNNVLTKNTLTLSQFGLDLMGMAFLPLNQFFLDAGVGGIAVWEKPVVKTVTGTTTQTESGNYNAFIRPKFTAGLGYNFTECLAATAQYSFILGNASGIDLLLSEGNAVPDIHAFTVGLQYTF